MTERLSRIKATCILTAATSWFYAPASADCWSALDSPEWPRIAQSVAAIQLCEQIPVGPYGTASVQVESFEFCSVSNSVATVSARAQLTCEFGSDALIQMPPLDGEIVAIVALDTTACSVGDNDLQISGEIGALLSGLEETQQVARDWAQSQLALLCSLDRP
ncbi:hypothetical protein [Rhizobium sp. Leaf453]|uniref:hypothetical protein n=1 Tax=Rhizobium sp. Leaf453 TaxID=1736380 RepID=UPI000ADBF998|nr:hypothetical protein [Rhizobium sp. Leaf453]